MSPNKKYLINLLSLLLIGILGSSWLVRYTEFFPYIGGLLGLGGIFTWVAFISNLVGDKKKEEFQNLFSEFLQGKTAPIVNGTLYFLFLLGVSFFGSISLRSHESDVERTVYISERPLADYSRSPESEGVLLVPNQSTKILVCSGLFGSREYWVKVSGLPAAIIKVSAFEVRAVAVPGSFVNRPIAFIRPSGKLTSSLESEPMMLTIRINGIGVDSIMEYKGEGVWVGCDRDVNLPAHLIDRWELEALKLGVPEIFTKRWQSPMALGPTLVLRDGDSLTAVIGRQDDRNAIIKSIAVRTPSTVTDFPQEIYIDE